ncbi:MAG: hypothetical protein ACRDS0_35950 [Pseudonocardiaceae bacterium]
MADGLMGHLGPVPGQAGWRNPEVPDGHHGGTIGVNAGCRCPCCEAARAAGPVSTPQDEAEAMRALRERAER